MYQLTIAEGQLVKTTIFFDEGDAEYAQRSYLDGLSERERETVDCELAKITMEDFVADMRKSGADDFEIWCALSNSVDGFAELERKAAAYDKMNAGSSKGGKKTWANLSAEERSARAKKAVEARIKKYGQKSSK